MENLENKLNQSQSEVITIYNFLESLPEEVLAPTKMKWRQLSVLEEVREASAELNHLKSYAKQLNKIATETSLIYVRRHLKSERELCSRTYDKSVAFNNAAFLTLGLLFVISTSFTQTLLVPLGTVYLLIFVTLVVRVIVTSRKYLQEFNLLNKLEALIEIAEQDFQD